MKKIIAMLVAIAVTLFSFGQTALAADTAAGAKVFANNCASCHAGGKNLVNASKTLKKADLEKFAMNTPEAITNQVTNGKAAMPAFKGRLNPEQIENVAAYVLAQADKDWQS